MGVAAFLAHELASRKARNPQYSLRAFARDLGTDHATLSQWMREKRAVTDEALKRICRRLGLPDAAIASIVYFDAFDLILLSAAVTMTKPTIARLSQTCGRDVDAINISVSRLLRLNMLKMEGDRWIAIERD